MKKTVLISICLAVLNFGAIGQGFETVAIMPQVGLNLSKFAFEPAEIDYGFRTGFQVGAYVRTNKTIFIQPGVFYSYQGNDLLLIDNMNYQSIRDNVNYGMLKVPVLFGIKIMNLRFYTGTTVSFLTNVSGNNFGLEREDFSWTSLGGNIGAGLNIGLFSLDCTYEFGLTNFAPNIQNRNNTLTISAGLHFAF
ncbi:MAG: outer membrane beta-barrel protein [Bacteroidales bacterium]|nr:outer membrane beta-barrel protein [Bacteroidales bacterium]